MRGASHGTGNTCAKLTLLVLVLAVVAFLSLSSADAAPADEGKAIFDQKCKACHTIGGGKLGGPDLKGLTERRDRASAIKFITAPTGNMPNLGISQQDAEKLAAYIESASKGETGQATSPKPASAAATAGDVERGRQLFIGGVGLSNSGPACASCHNVRAAGASWGGNLGKDLSASYSSLGADGIRSLLETTPFPIMRETYAGRPLTADEITYLTEFLQQASGAGQSAEFGNLAIFVALAAVGFVIVLALFHVAWRRRLLGVRQSLVKGGSK